MVSRIFSLNTKRQIPIYRWEYKCKRLTENNRQLSKFESQKKRLWKLLSKAKFGRSDRTQTCGLMVPNHPRYQLRHAPMYLIIPQTYHKRFIFASGQTCGQTTFIEGFAREYSAEKVNVYKAFRRFLFRETLGAVSYSQSKRATNCATSRSIRFWFLCVQNSSNPRAR